MVHFSVVGKSEEMNYPISFIVYALEDLIKRLNEIPQEDNDTTGAFRVETEFVSLQWSAVDSRDNVKR